MSTRTIFEFNHDLAFEVTQDPEEFVRALALYLASASTKDAERLERYGIRRVWWGHHSDDRKVVTKFSEYPL